MPAANPTRPLSRRDLAHRAPACLQTYAAPLALPGARDVTAKL